MSGEQIRLQVPPKLFGSQQLDRANDQAVNSRLLVQQQKMQWSQKRLKIVLGSSTILFSYIDDSVYVGSLTCNSQTRSGLSIGG